MASGLANPGGHNSHAVAAGGFLFVSGLVSMGMNGAFGPSIEVQAQRFPEMLGAIVGAEKLSKEGVVRYTAYQAGVEHWPAFNRAYAEFFDDHKPARGVVAVPGLHHGCLV